MAGGLNCFGLVVEDMARSLAFYQLLEVDVPADADEAPHAEAEIPGGMRLLWDTVETVRSYDPDWTPASGGPRMSLGFMFSSTEEVDSKYGELVEAGYHGHKTPWDAAWGQRYAVVHDPDGNSVDLFAAL